jgi:hypothetical protein
MPWRRTGEEWSGEKGGRQELLGEFRTAKTTSRCCALRGDGGEVLGKGLEWV